MAENPELFPKPEPTPPLSNSPQPLQQGGTKFAECFVCKQCGHLEQSSSKKKRRRKKKRKQEGTESHEHTQALFAEPLVVATPIPITLEPPKEQGAEPIEATAVNPVPDKTTPRKSKRKRKKNKSVLTAPEPTPKESNSAEHPVPDQRTPRKKTRRRKKKESVLTAPEPTPKESNSAEHPVPDPTPPRDTAEKWKHEKEENKSVLESQAAQPVIPEPASLVGQSQTIPVVDTEQKINKKKKKRTRRRKTGMPDGKESVHHSSDQNRTELVALVTSGEKIVNPSDHLVPLKSIPGFVMEQTQQGPVIPICPEPASLVGQSQTIPVVDTEQEIDKKSKNSMPDGKEFVHNSSDQNRTELVALVTSGEKIVNPSDHLVPLKSIPDVVMEQTQQGPVIPVCPEPASLVGQSQTIPVVDTEQKINKKKKKRTRRRKTSMPDGKESVHHSSDQNRTELVALVTSGEKIVNPSDHLVPLKSIPGFVMEQTQQGPVIPICLEPASLVGQSQTIPVVDTEQEIDKKSKNSMPDGEEFVHNSSDQNRTELVALVTSGEKIVNPSDHLVPLKSIPDVVMEQTQQGPVIPICPEPASLVGQSQTIPVVDTEQEIEKKWTRKRKNSMPDGKEPNEHNTKPPETKKRMLDGAEPNEHNAKLPETLMLPSNCHLDQAIPSGQRRKQNKREHKSAGSESVHHSSHQNAKSPVQKAKSILDGEICFFCGEVGHSLKSCPVSRAAGGLRKFAKCLICHAQGHLSYNCTRDSRGLIQRQQ